jgi:hypothetical protein
MSPFEGDAGTARQSGCELVGSGLRFAGLGLTAFIAILRSESGMWLRCLPRRTVVRSPSPTSGAIVSTDADRCPVVRTRRRGYVSHGVIYLSTTHWRLGPSGHLRLGCGCWLFSHLRLGRGC